MSGLDTGIAETGIADLDGAKAGVAQLAEAPDKVYLTKANVDFISDHQTAGKWGERKESVFFMTRYKEYLSEINTRLELLKQNLETHVESAETVISNSEKTEAANTGDLDSVSGRE